MHRARNHGFFSAAPRSNPRKLTDRMQNTGTAFELHKSTASLSKMRRFSRCPMFNTLGPSSAFWRDFFPSFHNNLKSIDLFVFPIELLFEFRELFTKSTLRAWKRVDGNHSWALRECDDLNLNFVYLGINYIPWS